MNNFEFYNPTRIIFGKDTIPDINNHIPEKVSFPPADTGSNNSGDILSGKLSLFRHALERIGPGQTVLRIAVPRWSALVVDAGFCFGVSAGGGYRCPGKTLR